MTIYRVTDEFGNQINRGDTVVSFRRELWTFVRVSRGPEYNGTAKVIVTQGGPLDDGSMTREFYDSVFNLRVVKL